MIAAYGPAVLDLPFEVYVSLWLNLPRVRLRKAAEFALGLKMAWGGGASRELAEALTETEEEAEDLYLSMKLAAKEERAARRAGL